MATAAGATVLGVMFGVLGPYGSYFNDGVPVRIAYWVGTIWVSLPIFGLSLWTAGALARRLRIPAWLATAAGVAAASAPHSLIVAAAADGLWPGVVTHGPFVWYVQVLCTSAIIVSTLALARRSIMRPAPAERAAVTPAQNVGSAAPLCLQMEDHYVRVHLPGGSSLVHGTLGAAIARAGAPGLRVHRSWWVARNAVAEPVFEGRSVRLRLVNGLLVPVARSRVALLRSEGWL